MGMVASMRRGLFMPPFDELAEPALLAELAALAEDRGWEGVFVWDHVDYRAPVRALADPWVALAAVAVATSRIRLGPLVTPLSRRRVHKLARETVTLDRLSGGRLTLGVGLGSDNSGELSGHGEETDPRARAELLDRGLEQLAGYWDGGFEPAPVQRPRIPIWVAGRWPNRRPLRRAARWDGFFPIDLPGPAELAELAAEVTELRERRRPVRPRSRARAGSGSRAVGRRWGDLGPDQLPDREPRRRGARGDRVRAGLS